MKYKVGDKVKVKSLKWYCENKDDDGFIYCCGIRFIPFMSMLCDCILTIKTIDQGFYHVEENLWAWAEDMFEGLAEDTIQPVILKNIIFSNENYIDKVELCLGDNYEIVVEGDKTFVQRKKSKYPMTYEECCDVLKIPKDERYIDIDVPLSYNNPLYKFTELLICRAAYWKIAGEEMGLGKFWEFENPAKHYVFTIEYSGGKIIRNAATSLMWNRILVFPTAEMRDAFYENFKKLIEKCKDLL